MITLRLTASEKKELDRLCEVTDISRTQLLMIGLDEVKYRVDRMHKND